MIKNILKPQPEIDRAVCTGCGVCQQSCPAKTIVLEDNRAKILLEDCINCFCCQEMCPAAAVKIKRSLLAKLLFASSRFG